MTLMKLKKTKNLNNILKILRSKLKNTIYEGHVFLVGGYVRDSILLQGKEDLTDFDFATTCNALKLVEFLYKKKILDHFPVKYANYGTAMVSINGIKLEFVTTRKEAYVRGSRKPIVEPGTLHDDVLRRDFTINTLMADIYSEEIFDPTGLGFKHCEGKILSTPTDPNITFKEDALRMLRAVRFISKYNLTPTEEVVKALKENASELKVISQERIRDELVKMLSLPKPSKSLNLLLEYGLIEYVIPEMIPLKGLEQGKYHYTDAWNHVLGVVDNVGNGDLVLSLAALLHDIAKPETRTCEDGVTHFFGHEVTGASKANTILRRLRFPNEIVIQVNLLIKNHMRISSRDQIGKSAIRRLVRDLGDNLDQLIKLAKADRGAHVYNTKDTKLINHIYTLIDEVRNEAPVIELQSPLSGTEIMEYLKLEPCKLVGEIKNYLTELVISGDILYTDKEKAKDIIMSYHLTH